jgi:hypothetical protein
VRFALPTFAVCIVRPRIPLDIPQLPPLLPEDDPLEELDDASDALPEPPSCIVAPELEGLSAPDPEPDPEADPEPPDDPLEVSLDDSPPLDAVLLAGIQLPERSVLHATPCTRSATIRSGRLREMRIRHPHRRGCLQAYRAKVDASLRTGLVRDWSTRRRCASRCSHRAGAGISTLASP